MIGRDGLHQVVVVQTDEPREVVRAVERESHRVERGLKRAKVQTFGVGQHTVKIEDDRARVRGVDHLDESASRSPAGMATCNRFSRGGTGHS